METNIKTNLLKQLAEHLLHGKLAHDRFDLSYYNVGTPGSATPRYDDDVAPDKCGALGCAIGEMPTVWPELFIWYGNRVEKIEGSVEEVSTTICEFFNINQVMLEHLFYPDHQKLDWGEWLSMCATKEQVASNIISFCKTAEEPDLQV